MSSAIVLASSLLRDRDAVTVLGIDKVTSTPKPWLGWRIRNVRYRCRSAASCCRKLIAQPSRACARTSRLLAAIAASCTACDFDIVRLTVRRCRLSAIVTVVRCIVQWDPSSYLDLTSSHPPWPAQRRLTSTIRHACLDLTCLVLFILTLKTAPKALCDNSRLVDTSGLPAVTQTASKGAGRSPGLVLVTNDSCDVRERDIPSRLVSLRTNTSCQASRRTTTLSEAIASSLAS